MAIVDTGYLMIRPSREEHRADHVRIVVRPTRSGNHRVLADAARCDLTVVC